MSTSFCNFVNEYYVRRFRESSRKRAQRLAGLTNREQALAYSACVRTEIRNAFNLQGRPEKPLSIHRAQKNSFGTYTLETFLFESRPGFHVSCDLYKPSGKKEKLPAVLLYCGHNPDGKSCRNGTFFAVMLANLGFAVLTMDPICQGERLQYQEPDESCENVIGHNMLGKKLRLFGEWFGEWRAWDAVCSIDVLWNLPEIDRSRIYAAGCSGGGTMTCWINALDNRIAGAVPSCYVTTWKRNVEDEMPVDAEQTPPGLAGKGLDIPDFLIAGAPKPVLILDEEDDFFDPRGTQESIAELRRFYSLLGAEDNVSSFIGPHGHGFWKEQREYAGQFLCRIAGIPFSDIEAEPQTVPSTEQKFAASGGQVRNIPGSRTMISLFQEKEKLLSGKRGSCSKVQLAEKIADSLKITQEKRLPTYRILRPEWKEKTTVLRYLLEDGDLCLGLLRHFADGECNHLSAQENITLTIPRWESLTENSGYLEPGQNHWLLDPFGLGELLPSSCDQGDQSYGQPYNFEYHFDSLGMMLGEPLAGIRVRAVMAAVRLLREHGAKNVTLSGIGQSAVTAACAALLLDTEVDQCILRDAPESYRELLGHTTDLPQSAFIPGFLNYADLPVLYRMVHAQIKHTETSAKTK